VTEQKTIKELAPQVYAFLSIDVPVLVKFRATDRGFYIVTVTATNQRRSFYVIKCWLAIDIHLLSTRGIVLE
jgi:hypothetical protein